MKSECEGDRDLAFTGWLIGHVEDSAHYYAESHRGIEVAIHSRVHARRITHTIPKRVGSREPLCRNGSRAGLERTLNAAGARETAPIPRGAPTKGPLVNAVVAAPGA